MYQKREIRDDESEEIPDNPFGKGSKEQENRSCEEK
jgi:hypothetical protein